MNYTLDSLFGVKDEVIVVCGGTRGIGREIANGLADLGAKLAIVATKQPACDQAAEELKARGAQDAIGCAADVTDFAAGCSPPAMRAAISVIWCSPMP